MGHEDRYGLPLGTASPAAARAYVEGADLLLAVQPGELDAFDRAAAADPGFALAHAARARALGLAARMEEARAAAARARARAAGASRRERQHVEAVALVVEGRGAEALAAVQAHVAEFPRDAVVLSLAHGAFGLIGFGGTPDHDAELLALLEGLAPHYGEDWWFLASHAWAFTEAGDPRRGRAMMERALGLFPKNANAAHGLAHACFEEGDTAAGADFVEGWLGGYTPEGRLHCHLSWHLALFELGRGRPERAWEAYRRAIAPGASRSAPLLTLTDAASLLWRLHLSDEGPRALPWPDVARFAGESYPEAGLAFADLHCAIAFAAAGDWPAFDARVAELERADGEGRLPPGPMVPAVARALGAFARGRWTEAVEAHEPVLPQVVRLGGSHAQRELVEDTLIQALLRAGRAERAAALLRERLGRRPSARDRAWLAAAGAPGRARATVQLDTERVRVTEWRFEPGDATGHHRHELDYVVVPLTTGPLLLREPGGERRADLVVGQSYGRRAGVEHDVVNASPRPFAFVEIELK